MDISDWISGHALRSPHRTAIRFDGRDLSYADFAQQIGRLASALAACGVARGRCVSYLGLNRPEELALLFACARLGALFMPLNWRLAAPEHRERLLDCPPAVLVVEDGFVAQTVANEDTLPPMTRVAIGSAPEGWITYDALLARAGSAARDATVTPQLPLLVCHTSGSTGQPKGVLLTQGALIANAANSVALHDMTAEDRILTNLPLFHVGGLNNQTTPALQAGATVVLHSKFDPVTTFDAIEQERITLTVLVPTQLTMMMALPRWQSADFSSLRMITTGSTIVPEHIIRAVHARGVPLVQIYGLTETCPIAAYLRAEDAVRKAGSTGRAAPHCELRVVDGDDRDVAPGARGEILIRGANVMVGYWKQPQATAAALAGGWFHSGDIGHFDTDGFLWVDGRAKDMIISGGENIAPAEIENVLLECPDVAEVAVVGRPDANWGEVVVAVIAPKAGRRLTSERVLALLDGRIARYKHPRQVLVVGELPKTALGKVRKEDVRRLVVETPKA
ncbi:MAG: acyl-CoA synthetase [Gemmatimonadota bacterium]